MKKIDIITFHSAHNYGAILQVYALQKVLGKENDVEVINYRNNNIDNTYKLINPETLKTILKSIIKNILYFRRNITRYNKFENIIKERLNLTKEDLKLLNLNTRKEIQRLHKLMSEKLKTESPNL